MLGTYVRSMVPTHIFWKPKPQNSQASAKMYISSTPSSTPAMIWYLCTGIAHKLGNLAEAEVAIQDPTRNGRLINLT